MDGRMDVWSWALCPNLNHHLCVYSWVVVLKWAVQEMFGQCVKQRTVQNMLSVKINRWQNSVCHCCWWWWSSLQTWQPPDTFNWWGPKWSKGQWMHHTQSPSLPLSNTLLYSSSPLPHLFPRVIDPSSVPFTEHTTLIASCHVACVWPHQARVKWHLSPAASQCENVQCCQWPVRWTKLWNAIAPATILHGMRFRPFLIYLFNKKKAVKSTGGCLTHIQQIIFLIRWFIFLSIKCQKIIKNAHYNFSEPKVASPNSLVISQQ